MTKFKSGILWIALVLVPAALFFACGDRTEELNNGVIYAQRALEQVNGNALARATYEGVVRNGGTPVDYIKQILPKEDPVFDSFEYQKPTKEWTIVIRPSTDANEYFIEGYGRDLKKPVVVKSVTVTLPEPEYTTEE